ncbi:hypothetical protein [Hymenobacter fastidiosus]|uniref:hypothetical protein n=1 Tax=Hymenobacter fastidiosus TaxID=486264 RepID=UPI0031E9CDDE
MDEYSHLIKRERHRMSGSGATEYQQFTVMNTNLEETSIKYGDSEIVEISPEYWWSMGSINKDISEFFFPNYEKPHEDMDTQFSLCNNYAKWKINRNPTGGKFSFIAFKDSKGSIMRVPTSLSGSTEFEHAVSNLVLLDYFKLNTTFKIFFTLSQVNNIEFTTADSKKNLAEFYNTSIRKWYTESLQRNPSKHAEFPIIDDMFAKLNATVHN